MDYLFGPLGKRYCNYFYYLSIMFLFFFGCACLMVIKNLFSKKKDMSFTSIYLILTQPFLMYFINRLYYSMCVNSLS
jgi:hypothetical protein